MTQAALGFKLSTMVRFALLLLAALAPLAQAQTYKWVDERGVVNYSNTPPPAGAKSAQQVEERISVYASAPPLAQPTAVDRRLAALEAEWLQRQRLMAAAAYAPPAPLYDDYRIGSYYGPYLIPVVAVRRPLVHHAVPVTPRVRTARAAVRLDLRR